MTTPGSRDHRLPGHVRPRRYRITLEPDLDAFIFSGTEEIDLEITRPTMAITLHSAELEIRSAEFVSKNVRLQGKVSYKDTEELATIAFPGKIPAGKGMLKLSFAGILNDKMRGFYRSRYEHEGKISHMATTQFESTDARRAFPCFDEPAQKAVFEVSLIVPDDRTVISNTLETEVAKHRAGYKMVRFAPSPMMSSYLLAFIVGHFEKIQTKTAGGTLVRVFTTPGKKHQARFALECASKCISFYEKYFGIRYPLPAMDLIAIPDFAAGAMENWGAVTYRETTILVDPEHSAVQNRQRVALVIAHELAHQWFGNLVTMEWWTHLWLNEGFATYMEYVAIDAIFPGWNIWDDFLLAEHARALALDGLANTHAIEIPVHHPQEINEIFDAISYSKGASVIRMFAEHLGERTFRKGLHMYLTRHAYGNAETADLWRALEQASGIPVRKMMDAWTKKPGYPLVTIRGAGNKIFLRQERFLANDAKKDTTLWQVPIRILYGAGFMKGNLGETAFVRVAYQPEDLKLLARAIKEGTPLLGAADRFGVIRDAFAFAQSGRISTDQALELADAYAGETSFIVWAQIADQMLSLRGLLFGKPEFDDLCRYARTFFSGVARRSGWIPKKGEPHDRTLSRGTLLYAAGTFGDTDIIAEARALFWKEQERRGSIHADVRAAVYNLVAQNGGAKEYRALLSAYHASTLEEERDRLLRALCSFKDTRFLLKTLERGFSRDSRGQDTIKALSFVFANPYGRSVAWKQLKARWPSIVKRFAGGHLLSRFVSLAAHLTTRQEAAEAESFFRKNAPDGIRRSVAQATEQIRSHAAWYERDRKKIKGFLRRMI